MPIVFLLNICVLIGTAKDIEEKTFTKFILNVLFYFYEKCCYAPSSVPWLVL
jgi:hypothetical protein